MSDGLCSARNGRFVSSLACATHRFHCFCTRQQRRGLNRLACSAGCECHPNRSRAHVIRKLHHSNYVVTAEAKPEVLDTSSHVLDRLAHHLCAVLWIPHQSRPALG